MLGEVDPDRPTATVELAPALFDPFPEFAGKWVWTCWARSECGAWIGPFDEPEPAMAACEQHFASNHTKVFWPDRTEDV